MEKTYLHEARRQAGLTQADMAEALGLTQSTYCYRENRMSFTAAEWKTIRDTIGEKNLNEAKKIHQTSVAEEAGANYEPSVEYAQLLKAVKRGNELQEAGLLAMADILASIKDKSHRQALIDLKKLYREKTGKSIDL